MLVPLKSLIAPPDVAFACSILVGEKGRRRNKFLGRPLESVSTDADVAHQTQPQVDVEKTVALDI